MISRKLRRASGGARVSALTAGTATLSSTDTIAAAPVAGELLILLDYAYKDVIASGGVSYVLPAGFVELVTSFVTGGTNYYGRLVLSAKISDGTETSIVGMNPTGSFSARKILKRFAGDVPINAITISAALEQGTSGNPAPQDILAGAATPPVLLLAAHCSAYAVSPRTWAPAKDGEAASTSSTCYLAWKIYDSSPADHSVDMDDEGRPNTLASLFIEVE